MWGAFRAVASSTCGARSRRSRPRRREARGLGGIGGIEVWSRRSMEKLLVDGVDVYRLTLDEAEQVLSEEVFLGVPLAKLEFLRSHLSISRSAPSFEIALGRPSGQSGSSAQSGSWVVVHLVRIADQYVRVRVEGVTCFGCRQSVLVGNPVDYQIYEGVGDTMAAIALARRRPTVPCPTCRKALSRPAIVVHST